VTVIGFIFARGGSKGLPDKNIRPFGGKPLIAWSIEQARQVLRINRIMVSTDSPRIAEIAQSYGAEVPFLRPSSLAQDQSSEWSAWQHALMYLKENEGALPRLMVSIPTTAPLRWSDDIEQCIDEYDQGDADIVITVTEAHRNPFFNMVRKNADGSVELVISSQSKLARRQEAPTVFDMTTVAYAANPEFVLTNESIFDGRVRSVFIPRERAIDIDTLFDFEVAEFLMKKSNE
jgi:CMP-N-acetylneuraminic acid synthetase